jgi:DNA repair protein RadC
VARAAAKFLKKLAPLDQCLSALPSLHFEITFLEISTSACRDEEQPRKPFQVRKKVNVKVIRRVLAMKAYTVQAYELLRVRDSSPKSKRAQRLLNGKATTGPDAVLSAVKPFFRNLDREKFGVLVLNSHNAPVAFHCVSVGCLDSAVVHPREVFKFAILSSAASVIFVHNHPSGCCDPSSEDINLTRRLVEAGELMGIPVLDHIIITDDAYLSMKSRNLI